MSKEMKMICVACPMGCEMVAAVEDGKLADLKGHACKRGIGYAEAEITNPTRGFHSTLRVEGGEAPLVSIKSAAPVPKGLLMACAEATRSLIVKAPIAVGDVLLPDVCGTGVDLIATTRVLAG
jgi:CxxC motif-containing protein